MRATAAWTRDQILKLLHPFMPYITEELWARTAEGASPRATLLIEAPWPDYAAWPASEAARAEMRWVVALVSSVRSVRSEMNVPAAAKIALVLKDANKESRERLARHRDSILTLARLATAEPADAIRPGPRSSYLEEAIAAMPLGDVIDFAKERCASRSELKSPPTTSPASTPSSATPTSSPARREDVIEEQKERRAEAEATVKRLKEAVSRLG